MGILEIMWLIVKIIIALVLVKLLFDFIMSLFGGS